MSSDNRIKTIVELDVNQAQRSIVSLNAAASDSTKSLEERIIAKNKQVEIQNQLSKQTINSLENERRTLEGRGATERELKVIFDKLNKAKLDALKVNESGVIASNKLQAAQDKLSASTAKSEGAVKSLRVQLREGIQAQAAMSAKFGETSIEAIEAAKNVANLKDQIQFNADLVASFNPDQKFKALGAATQVAATGMSGVVSGMALFGDQSEDTQKSLLKVQAAMAFSDAISNLSNIGDQMKTLKATIVGTWTSLTTVKAIDTTATGANTVAVVTNTGAVVAETAAVGGSTIATTAATVATNLWNASLAIALAPITLIVAGIAGLVLGIGYLTGAFGDFSGNSAKAAKDTAILTEHLDKESLALARTGVAVRDKNQQSLALAKANGASTESIRTLERKLLDEQIATDKASAATASNTFIQERNALAKLKSSDASEEVIKAREKEVSAAYDTFKRENSQLDASYKEKHKLIKSQEIEIAKEKNDARVENAKRDEESSKKSSKDREEADKRRIANQLAFLANEIQAKRNHEESTLKLELEYLEKKNSLELQAKGLNKLELQILEQKHQIAIDEIKKTYSDKDNEAARLKVENQITLDELDIQNRRNHGENTLALELELLEKKRVQDLTAEGQTIEEKKIINEQAKQDKIALEANDAAMKLEAQIAIDEQDLEARRLRGENVYALEKALREEARALELSDTTLTAEAKAAINQKYDNANTAARQTAIDTDLAAAGEAFGISKEIKMAEMIMAAPTAIGNSFTKAAEVYAPPVSGIMGAVGAATVIVPIIKGLADIKKTRFPGKKGGGSSGGSGGGSISSAVSSVGSKSVGDISANNAARLGVDPSIGNSAASNAANRIVGGNSLGVVFSESKYNDFKSQVQFKESKTTI